MAAGFFTPWPTWVKLVFILGCGIIATIAAGFAKLWYTRRKLRKYSAVASDARQEQELQSRSGQIPVDPLEDVPFGIRALESGIEVEGIWISRSNTPEPASRQGSRISVRAPLAEPHINDDPQNLFGVASLSAPGLNRSSSAFRASTSFERSVFAERLSSSQPSRDSSPDASMARDSRSRYPPSSYAKYSNHPQLRRYSTSAATPSLHDTSQHGLANGHESEEGTADMSKSTKPSTSNTEESESTADSTPSLSDVKHQAHEDNLVNFELMRLHRLALAAETGQLTPPARRSRQEGSSGRPSQSSRRASSNDEGNYFNVKLKPEDVRSNPNFGDAPDDFEFDVTQLSVNNSSLPNVGPFTEYSQNLASLSRPLNSARDGAESLPLKTTLRRSPAIRVSKAAELVEPSAPQTDSFYEETRCDQTLTKEIEAQVLRGRGTGFEILEPGSFNNSCPSPGDVEERLPTAPPTSLRYVRSRGRPRKASGRRKLTKKQRDTSKESGTTSDTDRRSRTSTL